MINFEKEVAKMISECTKISEEEIVISRRILAQKIDAFLDKQELIEAK